MIAPKIANHQAREYVRGMKSFTGSNMFAHWVIGRDKGLRYVVYSYGKHWPMFIYDSTTNRWYENFSKFSRTTSKHRSQANPLLDPVIFPTTFLHVEDMIKLASDGITALIAPLEEAHTV